MEIGPLLQKIIDYCKEKDFSEISFPFNEETMVFKANGKIFALLGLDAPHYLNLKCDPDLAIALRSQYSYVIPGYHMNKKHWNSIVVGNEIDFDLVFKWIDHSHTLITQKNRR